MRVFILFVFLTLFVFNYASTINVPDDQVTIQGGINVAVDGDTVLVQPGIYLENIDFSGKNIRLTSLYSATQDTSYISGTVIDGNQAGSVVTINSGENSHAVLSGFTIANGYNYEYGGGIFIENSAPCFDNLIISNNSTHNGGGALYCYQGSVTLNDSRVLGNISTDSHAGGLYIRFSTFHLNNTLLADNISGAFYGGALFASYSYTYISGCLIRDNYINGSGGGILVDTNYLIEITDTEICYNTAEIFGGGFRTFNCESLLNRVSIHHNSATMRGGGVSIDGSDTVMLNCTVADNQVSEDLGTAIDVKGGISLFLLNCIIYDNPGTSWSYDDSYVQAAYSDIEDYEQYGFIEPLENVIDEDPLFLDHPLCDYFLRQNSPCHNSGIDCFQFSSYNYEAELEVEEYMGIMPDMGAYEFYEANGYSDDNITPVSPGLSCYPNPFNPETSLLFRINEPQKIDLRIYNLKGQLINILCSETLPAGEHHITWNGKNRLEQDVSSGVYLALLKTASQQYVMKLILLK
ncbi:MAG: T9SS type A sorting domain-containing protein [Candidatus Cloacimonetes bacterium]|nr:T9SS type A sorting domain-containing protein [Candidatus Cloacimonadota bacterium]